MTRIMSRDVCEILSIMRQAFDEHSHRKDNLTTKIKQTSFKMINFLVNFTLQTISNVKMNIIKMKISNVVLFIIKSLTKYLVSASLLKSFYYPLDYVNQVFFMMR